jgi:hypothetical protein
MSKLPKILTEKYEQVITLTEKTREDFIKLLKSNILIVTFTKTNGERRVMRCTLKDDLLPPKSPGYTPKEKKINPNVVAVFDLDKNEWRSFQINSVIDYKIEQ